MIIGGKTTNPGELRTQIAFHRRTVTSQAGGYQATGREKIADGWAKWTNAHGQEAWTASTLQAEKPATVLVRYRADVDSTCLVEMGGEFYEIVSMDNIQQRCEYIELKVQLWREG